MSALMPTDRVEVGAPRCRCREPWLSRVVRLLMLRMETMWHSRFQENATRIAIFHSISLAAVKRERDQAAAMIFAIVFS
jgi:hypothetical protein